MNVRRIPFWLYSFYLSRRWKMSWASGKMVAEQFLQDYREKRLPYHKIWSIHKNGFFLDGWLLYELDKHKCKTYLSDVQYYSLHPINGEFSKWIDGKLTLKYLCSGTELDRYMPAYYYQFDEKGRILCLVDCENKKTHATTADIAQLLRDRGALAIKLMSSYQGKGFYKAEYRDNCYYLNGKSMDEAGFMEALTPLRNYLVTEYFRPHPELEKYCSETPSCIRYILGRTDGEVQVLTGGLAIGTKKSGFVENYAVGGVWCYLDQNGYYETGDILDSEAYKNRVITHHPDSGAELKGRIPHWDEIVEAGNAFCAHFPQLKYLGFDFVVTSDDRVKILEVNSLSSLDCLQHATSIFETNAGAFFRSLMRK